MAPKDGSSFLAIRDIYISDVFCGLPIIVRWDSKIKSFIRIWDTPKKNESLVNLFTHFHPLPKSLSGLYRTLNYMFDKYQVYRESIMVLLFLIK